MKTLARTARLGLESLDDRIVPAAHLSLLTRGAVVEQPGFVAFQGHTAAPTGSQLDTFLSVEGRAGRAEQGLNTDARPVQFDEIRNRARTESRTIGEVPVVNRNGVNYREFLLEMNEAGNPRLSLDDVRIFVGSTGNLRATAAEAASGVQTLQGQAPVFNLDANGDVAILMNSQLRSGGFGDITLLVPDSAFTGYGVNDFVYFYTRMGAQTGYASNGLPDNWATRIPSSPTDPPPGGGTGNLSLSGFVRLDGSVDGIADVVINLTGFDANDQPVNLTTTTDGNGFFEFTGLLPGTYTLSEDQPVGFEDGPDFVGNNDEGEFPGVIVGDDEFSNIVLVDQNGTDFLFLEQLGGE